MELFGLEGTLKIPNSNPSAKGRDAIHYTGLSVCQNRLQVVGMSISLQLLQLEKVKLELVVYVLFSSCSVV